MNNRDILGEVSKYMNTKGRGSLASIGPHTLHLMPKVNNFEKLWYKIFKRGLKPGEGIWMKVANAYIIFIDLVDSKHKITAEIQGSANDRNMIQMLSIFNSVFDNHGIKKTKLQSHYTLTLGKDSEFEIAFAELFIRCYNTFRERLVVYLTMKDKNESKPFPQSEFMDVLKEIAPMPKYSMPLTGTINRTRIDAALQLVSQLRTELARVPPGPQRNAFIAQIQPIATQLGVDMAVIVEPPPHTSPTTQRRRIINEDDSLPTSAAQALLKHGKLDESVRVRREKKYLPKLAEAGPAPHLGGKRPHKSVKK